MGNEFKSLIEKAKTLARARDIEAAMRIADQLVESNPRELEVWMLRSHLHGLSHNYYSAISDLDEAISINSLEPALFHERGDCYLQIGNYLAAIHDFSEGLRLCDFHQNDYYRESLHFFRAEAFLRLGRKKETLADLARVRDELKTWTYKLRSKSDLLAEALRLPD